MVDGTGTKTYNYDARDRLTSKATPQGTLTYTYDAASNLHSMRSSNTNGITVTYTYDELNRLKTVLDNRLGAGANTSTYVYSPTSTLKSVTLPNGVVTNYGYDTLDRLKSLVSKKNTTTLGSFTYTLRPEGNRSQVVEFGVRTVAYTYDNAYRLLSETITGGSVNGALGYTYDAVGNRLSRTSTVSGILPASYTYDNNDRLNGNTYNNNGNTIVVGSITYTYDFADRLTSATGGISINYDGDGNRVQETTSTGTTQYLVDDLNPTGYAQVVEELSGGAVQRTYTYGHDLISQNRLSGGAWTPRFYGYDGLGSVRFLTDATGTKTDGYDYDAFGSLISMTGSTPNPYLFSGEQFDSSLGLYYLRARYYNTGVGRFWSRDTAAVDRENPRELNRYVYVADNPVNATDPTGHVAFPEYGKISTTFQNVTKTAVVYGHRVGGAIAAAKGAFDALDARIISQHIRTGLEQINKVGAMNNLTVAQSTITEEATGATRIIVAINGAQRSGPVLQVITNVVNSLKARGIDAFIADGDLHAERAVYARALQYTKDFVSIGISNTKGPCGPTEQNCAAFFDQLKITVFFLGKLLVEKT